MKHTYEHFYHDGNGFSGGDSMEYILSEDFFNSLFIGKDFAFLVKKLGTIINIFA